MNDDTTIDWNRISAQCRADHLVQRYGIHGATEVAQKQARFYRNDPYWGSTWRDTLDAVRAWFRAVEV